MAQAQVTNIRPAGADHQVVTVVGGDGGYCKQPCAQCPWRKDQRGSFPTSAFKHSANTAYDMASRTFACHMAGAEKPMTCAGFLLNGSAHNMAVRIAIIKGDIDPREVTDGGHDLYGSYRAMALTYNELGTILYCDQHAQRNHYITAVIRTAGLKVAQDLARHSTPNLTSKYGRLEMSDYAKGLEGLPRLKRPGSSGKRKSG